MTGVGLGGSAIVLVLIYDKKKLKYIILKFKFNKWARILYLRSYFAFVLPKSICHLPGCGFGKCGLVYVVVSNECFSSGAGMLSSEHSEHDAKKLVSIKRYIFKVLPLGSYYVKQVWLFVLFLYSLCVFQGEEGREEGGGLDFEHNSPFWNISNVRRCWEGNLFFAFVSQLRKAKNKFTLF